MHIKKLKRKCSVRGCRNTDTFALSRTREQGNSIIICRDCLREAAEAVGSYHEEEPERGKSAGVKKAPPLFYNAEAQGSGNASSAKDVPIPEEGVGAGAKKDEAPKQTGRKKTNKPELASRG